MEDARQWLRRRTSSLFCTVTRCSAHLVDQLNGGGSDEQLLPHVFFGTMPPPLCLLLH